MTLVISQRALDMIVEFEVNNAATYTALYASPTWPGDDSGVTIGIGYDLGQSSAKQIAADWSAHFPAAIVARLVGCAGITGLSACKHITSLHDIVVPFTVAQAVFATNDVPRYTAMTAAVFPHCDELSPDSRGALVSLVYNRGTDLSRQPPPDRRLEMRQIAAAMSAREFAAVPGYIRAMKRLWRDGLVARREKEAALFEDGLIAPVPPAADTDPADLLMDEMNPSV